MHENIPIIKALTYLCSCCKNVIYALRHFSFPFNSFSLQTDFPSCWYHLYKNLLFHISPIKLSIDDKKERKSKERKVLNFTIKNDETLHWGVIFPRRSTDYLVTFLKIVLVLVLGSIDSPLVTTTMTSLLMTLHLYIIEINFERKLSKRNISTKEQVINKYAIFDIVNWRASFITYNQTKCLL